MSSKGWKKVKIESSPMDIIDGDRGSHYPKQDEFYDSEHCLFLNTSNVTTQGFNFEKTMFITHEKDNLLRKGKLQKFDIILTTRGTVGNVAFYDESVPYENIRINSGMVIFRNSDPREIETKYFYQFLRSSIFSEQVLSHSSGSAQPQLPIKDLKQIELPVPPLPTQRRIADILCALDDKIEINRQTNATLEAIVQAIFKEWFVDFNFPGSTGEMIESELGVIPSGWRVGKLDEISEKITKGTTPSTLGDKFVDQGIRFLRAECIQDDLGIDLTKSLFITAETNNKLKRSQLAENDILVTIAGSIGRMGVVTKRVLPANLNQAIGIIRLDSKNIPITYAYYYLKQQTIRNELLSGITQSVQANISLTDLNNIKIMIPPKNLLETFDSIVKESRYPRAYARGTPKSKLNCICPLSIFS